VEGLARYAEQYEVRYHSNLGVNADNQELTTQVSQRDSQNPNIITDAELRRVIEAWGKLPANLKMAIIGSSNLHM